MDPVMEWSMTDTLDLIDRYREREVLWDTNHPNYKLSNDRESAWNELATLFGTTPFQVKRKIKSLLASYRRERVKLDRAGTKAEESSKWFAFEKLSFMKDIYTPRNTTQRNENGMDNKGDVDFMAELLDVSLREGGTVYVEEESGSQDCDILPLPLTTEYKTSETSNFITNLTNGGNYSRKRKKPEEPFDHYYPDPRRDELAVYGEHIANELRHLDRRTLCKVKHMINNIIYEAQMSSDLDSSEKVRSQNVPDSRIASPSSTNPSGLLRVRRETADDSEFDDEPISSIKVERD